MNTSPTLPAARGEVSAGILRALRGAGPPPDRVVGAEPYGEDLQLSLNVLYELHYQGFEGVDDRSEWDPELLRLRAELERRFLGAVRDETTGGTDVEAVLADLLVEPLEDTGTAGFLAANGQVWQLREFFVHRSIYHLKEADPHAWVIPRLRGEPKAALVAVEFDEFGGGRSENMHAQLYADLLAGAGLDPGYLHYLDRVPASMLAVVNLMSLFGLHRALRGALVGHFAAAEISTPPTAKRMLAALDRLAADSRCVRFYAEHLEADAVHEQVMRHDVIVPLLSAEPQLTADVVLGIQATELVEERFGQQVLSAWQAGESSLRVV